MSVGVILKILNVYLLATVKYFLTFPYAIVIGLDYTQTIIAVTVGGISGFIFFYYFSGFIIRYFNTHKEALNFTIRKYFSIDLGRLLKRKPRTKPVSTKRMRSLVKFRKSYGLWGIIIMTPVVLSIPIGAFLLKKYYSTHKNVFAYMMISILGWSLVFTTIAVIMPKPL
ncbi:MAG: hypothetical protein ABFD10_01630 [Prolixibacteraceae bacterium]